MLVNAFASNPPTDVKKKKNNREYDKAMHVNYDEEGEKREQERMKRRKFVRRVRASGMIRYLGYVTREIVEVSRKSRCLGSGRVEVI